MAAALESAGPDIASLVLQRAEGGLSQLYRVGRTDGRQTLVKVYSTDSRDADLLYRSFRWAVLRGADDGRPSVSVEQAVEHQALMLVLARGAGVRCPEVEVVAVLPDGSALLGLAYVDGRRLDTLGPEEIGDDLLDGLWAEVHRLHAGGLAHRSLRAANVLVEGGRPVVIDFGFARASAEPRLLAVDRAELLASLGVLVGPERALASALRVVGPDGAATALPFLQPLALSASTRRHSSKAVLEALRTGIVTATGDEPAPLVRLARVRIRTLVTIISLTAAFYILLPQLASVHDSLRALRSASWGWLLVAVAMSLATYVSSALSMSGSVPAHLPLVPNVEAQLASSFVNRVTPANVGGMALNVRFLRKAGLDPAQAVTGVGLNNLVGGFIHLVLLVVFVAWAGHGGGSGFAIPSSSKVLVVIAVVLAAAGIASATAKGRRLIRTHVVTFVKTSAASVVSLARSPLKLALLFGGSAGITLAYIAALAAAIAALHGMVSFAQVGAVYLGASIIAAAAPTPGGLGALEAALVAGFTGIGTPPGIAVAAVLTYRLVTYWLPIFPGWVSLQHLERANLL